MVARLHLAGAPLTPAMLAGVTPCSVNPPSDYPAIDFCLLTNTNPKLANQLSWQPASLPLTPACCVTPCLHCHLPSTPSLSLSTLSGVGRGFHPGSCFCAAAQLESVSIRDSGGTSPSAGWMVCLKTIDILLNLTLFSSGSTCQVLQLI